MKGRIFKASQRLDVHIYIYTYIHTSYTPIHFGIDIRFDIGTRLAIDIRLGIADTGLHILPLNQVVPQTVESLASWRSALSRPRTEAAPAPVLQPPAAQLPTVEVGSMADQFKSSAPIRETTMAAIRIRPRAWRGRFAGPKL